MSEITRRYYNIYGRRCEAGVGLEYSAVAAFPSDLSNKSSSDFVYFASCIGTIRVRDSGNEGSNIFGLVLRYKFGLLLAC